MDINQELPFGKFCINWDPGNPHIEYPVGTIFKWNHVVGAWEREVLKKNDDCMEQAEKLAKFFNSKTE